jgi:hypothetical protein
MGFPEEVVVYVNPLRIVVVAVIALLASIAVILLSGRRKR